MGGGEFLTRNETTKPTVTMFSLGTVEFGLAAGLGFPSRSLASQPG